MTLAEHIAKRRRKWTADADTTLHFATTVFRLRLNAVERQRIAKEERVPIEYVTFNALGEYGQVKMIESRLAAETAHLKAEIKRLAGGGVRLRRSRQAKKELELVRAEMQALLPLVRELRERSPKTNPVFAALRRKFPPPKPQPKVEPPSATAKAKPMSFAEACTGLKSKAERDAYIELRRRGKWRSEGAASCDWRRIVFDRAVYKRERRSLQENGSPLIMITFAKFNKEQRVKLYLQRAEWLLAKTKADYPNRCPAQQRHMVATVRALTAEVAWLDYQRELFAKTRRGEPSFADEWNAMETARLKAVDDRKEALRAAHRAERIAQGLKVNNRYATEEERHRGYLEAQRRYRERKALADGRAAPRRLRRYANDIERAEARAEYKKNYSERYKAKILNGEWKPSRPGRITFGWLPPLAPPREPLAESEAVAWWGDMKETMS